MEGSGPRAFRRGQEQLALEVRNYLAHEGLRLGGWGATASSRVSLGCKVCFKTDKEPLHSLDELLSLQPVPEFQLPGTLLRAISGAWPFAEGEVWTPGRCSLLVFPAEARRE